ncbi:MAG: GAF domain-containing protein [Chloroflexota bacterium]
MSLALAVVMVVAAELVKVWLDDHLGGGTGFVIPYLGVIVAAVIGGWWPGILATALIAGTEALVHLPPEGLSIADPIDQLRLLLFVLGGVLMSALCELGLRARASTEQARTAERAARLAAERAAERGGALADLSAELNAALTRDEIARHALDRSVRVVGADRGAFLVPDETGTVLRVAAETGYPSEAVQALREVPMTADLPAAEAARTRRAVLIGDRAAYLARYPSVAAVLPTTASQATAAQPLLADGMLLGVLGWAFGTEQVFDPGMVEFLEAIASLTVQALERAAAFDRERAARRQAEEASRRLDLIVQAGQALGATLDYDTTLIAMARAAIPFLGDVCVVDLLEETGVRRFVATADPGASALAAWLGARTLLPDSDHPIALAMQERASRRLDIDGDAAPLIEDLPPGVERLRRMLIVPLVVRDQAIGALTFATAAPDRRYDDADQAVAEVLASRAAKAMENARLHQQVRELASHERTRAGELESVLAAIGEGIVVVGPDGRVHSANAAAERILGGPPPDLAALTARLGPGADRLLDPGTAFGPDELQLLGRPGTWVEVTAYPTVGAGSGTADGDDVTAGSVLVLRDVTAFRQGQGLREAFLGLLSHELRTPVTSIYAAATVLGQPERGLPEDVRADILTDIVAESDRLYRLVEDLLVLARFDEGLELVREPSLLQRVVPSVVASEQPRWPRTRLVAEVDRDLPAVMGDETSIQQVVRNLVSNAAKYGPPGEPVDIRVSVATAHDGVEVRVLDRGPGVAGPEAEAIFAPFYRSPSTARVAGGAGIGLFVCRRLVEAMSGRIWAAPREGGGSEFGFWLPRYVHAAGDDLDDLEDLEELPEGVAAGS